MAMIDDMITWACTLPGWQGYAVRLLLEAGEQPGSAENYSEIWDLSVQ